MRQAGGSQNFTRVETFGDHAEADNTDVQWVKVVIDPDAPEVFWYQPQVVRGNLSRSLNLLPTASSPSGHETADGEPPVIALGLAVILLVASSDKRSVIVGSLTACQSEGVPEPPGSDSASRQLVVLCEPPA